MRLVVGDRLGPYVIQAEIGRGGQAVVYRAMQEGLERQVALKIFDPAAAAGPGSIARFHREAIAAARVEHPRIVPVYDAGEVDGRPYLAMRLIDGPSLAEVISREGPMQSERALQVLDDIAQALDFAHTHGLVHRDVKPGNVLLDRGGAAFLTDFGVARLDDRPGMTRPGQWLGTVEYLSPEQVEGQAAGPASDRYGFACLAFEVLTGRPPFVAREATRVLLAHTRESPPAVSEINPLLPVEADRAFAAGLAKDPDDRPRSCQSFLAELRSVLSAPGRRLTVVGAATLPQLPAEDPWRRALSRFTVGGETEGASRGGGGSEEAKTVLLPALGVDRTEADGGPTQRWRVPRRRLLIGGVAAAVLATGLVGGFFLGENQAGADAAKAAGYQAGKSDGFSAGRHEGYDQGHTAGLRDGIARGRTIGGQIGRKQGYQSGYTAGYDKGLGDGKTSAFSGFDTPFVSGDTYLVTFGMDSQGKLYIAYRSSGPLSVGECLYVGVNSSASGC